MKEKLELIKFIVIDVDGVLTDSGLYYDNNGNEIKKFSTRDYVGISAAHYIGIKVIVLTGRECIATDRRVKELKVDETYQGIKNKREKLMKLTDEKGIGLNEIAYIGDDLNDYSSMNCVGFKACPSDAAPEIKEICDYVSLCKGGSGVVQDVFRYILEALGKWEEFLNDCNGAGY